MLSGNLDNISRVTRMVLYYQNNSLSLDKIGTWRCRFQRLSPSLSNKASPFSVKPFSVKPFVNIDERVVTLLT